MIDGNEVGDTAAFYPDNRTLFHYKRSSYFMFNGRSEKGGMTQYSTGIKRFHSAEGTWRDAEDGELMGNSISQGSVDSTISFRTAIPAGEREDDLLLDVGRYGHGRGRSGWTSTFRRTIPRSCSAGSSFIGTIGWEGPRGISAICLRRWGAVPAQPAHGADADR